MWLLLFCLHYFTILAEKVFKYCKIRISTVVYPGHQHSVCWGFFFCFFLFLEGIDSQAVKAHCITDWPRRGAQRLCASWMVLTSNCRAHGPCTPRSAQFSTRLGFIVDHLQFQVRIFKLLKVKCVHPSTLHKGQKQAGATAPLLEGPVLLEPLPVGALAKCGTQPQPGSHWHFLTFSSHTP